MPVLPSRTAARMNHGPGAFRNANCPARPASGMASSTGTKRWMSTAASTAHAAANTKGACQENTLAISVPAGTPIMLATVWPRTMVATAWPSRPGSASILDASVAVPKNAPCGRPAMKRPASSIIGSPEIAERALPAAQIAMNRMMSRRGGTRRPTTSIVAPTQTPTAYAVMKLPAQATVTSTPSATTGRMPIMTNSANPSTNAPMARAMRLFFIVDPTLSHSKSRTAQERSGSSWHFCTSG